MSDSSALLIFLILPPALFSIQCWLLRRHFKFPLRWIPASIGAIIAALFFMYIASRFFINLGLAVEVFVFLLTGAIFGELQSLVLRKLFTQTRWWVLASALSFGWMAFLLQEISPFGDFYASVISFFLVILIYSALTGFALLKMEPKI